MKTIDSGIFHRDKENSYFSMEVLQKGELITDRTSVFEVDHVIQPKSGYKDYPPYMYAVNYLGKKETPNIHIIRVVSKVPCDDAILVFKCSAVEQRLTIREDGNYWVSYYAYNPNDGKKYLFRKRHGHFRDEKQNQIFDRVETFVNENTLENKEQSCRQWKLEISYDDGSKRIYNCTPSEAGSELSAISDMIRREKRLFDLYLFDFKIILFGYLNQPSFGCYGVTCGGFSLTLYSDGTLLYRTGVFDSREMEKKQYTVSNETVEAVKAVLREYDGTINALDESINNLTLDGTSNEFVFGGKWIYDPNISYHSDCEEEKIIKPGDLTDPYLSVIKQENEILYIFDRIAKIFEDEGVSLSINNLLITEKI